MTGTLRVRNIAQKVLWEQELSGQISDGHWENSTPNSHWKPWCSAQVVVDPEHVGRDFWAQRESYNFSDKRLLDVVSDRMLEYVRRLTGDASYDMKQLRADLNDLKVIIKQHVPHGTPVPTQPRTYEAKLRIDGYGATYRAFVKLDDDPEAVAYLERQREQHRAYRVKQLEKKLADLREQLAKAEAELTAEVGA